MIASVRCGFGCLSFGGIGALTLFLCKAFFFKALLLGFGEKGRSAVRELLARGAEAGLLPASGANVDFLSETTP